MWEYLFLGFLQGVLEWIPVSSEGVTALASELFVSLNPVDVALFLHAGTLLAVLVYFREDWKEVFLLRDVLLLRFLVIATAVSLLLGYLLYDLVRTVAVGGALLAVVGFGLLVTSYLGGRDYEGLPDRDWLAVVAGVLQGLAVIPGLSRSGSTVFGLSLGDLEPGDVLKYSYMMSVPAVLASTVYVWLNNPLIVSAWPSVVTSFIFGLLTLKVLMRWSREIDFSKFTLAFGILCLLGAAVLAL